MRWLHGQWAQHHRQNHTAFDGSQPSSHGKARFGTRSGDLVIPASAITAQPLEDILLKHLPYVTQGWISDAIVNSAAAFCIIGGLLMISGWQAKLVLLRRVAWMMATLYFIRSITISVTTMPPNVQGCIPVVSRNSHEMVKDILGMITGSRGACTDKIFSGHTTILTISFLFWSRYARHWVFIVYSAIHGIIGITSVLMVRYHYTVDVVL
ncbi:hypothetical protein GQ54DRAFT_265473, partial [Martensiomyces pterosporus]